MSTETLVKTHECAELRVTIRDKDGADVSSRFAVERTTGPGGEVTNRILAKPEAPGGVATP